MPKPSAKDFPHTWWWKIPQIEAALRDPSTPAHILEELRAMERIVTEDLKNAPGVKLYRAHADLLRQLPALRDANLEEALDTVQTVRSHGAKKAGTNNTGPRKSRYAAEFPEWESVAIATLRADPDAANIDIAREIKRRTKTTAALRMITTWCAENQRTLQVKANTGNATRSPLSI